MSETDLRIGGCIVQRIRRCTAVPAIMGATFCPGCFLCTIRDMSIAGLFHDLGADLANDGVLIAGAAAATYPANQLAAFDQRKSTGARH